MLNLNGIFGKDSKTTAESYLARLGLLAQNAFNAVLRLDASEEVLVVVLGDHLLADFV